MFVGQGYTENGFMILEIEKGLKIQNRRFLAKMVGNFKNNFFIFQKNEER